MTKFKVGDKVVFNDKFGTAAAHAGEIYEVASTAWVCMGNEMVKLKGQRGGFRVDALELWREE